MTGRRDFLFEIGTEELPPKALAKLSEALGAAVKDGMQKARLGFDDLRTFATARRLAVLVDQLAELQPDTVEERRGPALTAAFDENGNPTQAAEGFARSCGVGIDELEQLKTDKGAWLILRRQHQGRDVRELLPGIISGALAALPIPRRMRWGALESAFVRPVHWLVMLYGDEVVPLEMFDIAAGRETRGHRYHRPEPLYLSRPADYAPLLESEGHVIADFSVRREAVRAQVMEAAARLDAHADLDDELLDEVTAIVEWPRAFTGSFDPRFLDLPEEVLISVMRRHQKYFHLRDAQRRLLPYFIAVSNIESRDPDVVRAGNERVIRPRLSDAIFFRDLDRGRRLDSRVDGLSQVVFQRGLGSLYQKTERIVVLAAGVAGELGGDRQLAERAAWLSKCDLLTEMVGEFPELQGVMGRCYAADDGEHDEVTQALAEQYQPRGAGDRLPLSATGQALAIADRLDTLAGIFGLDMAPSGDKDPFALRRAALGVLRIMIEGRTALDLEPLISAAFEAYQSQGISLSASGRTKEQLYYFMMERLRAYYHEHGIGPELFDAVLSRRVSRPADFDARLNAVRIFQGLPEAGSLATANKRIANILRKADEKVPDRVDPALLSDPAEQSLAAELDRLSNEVAPLIDAGNYADALRRLAGLRTAVDAFFDDVMVMSDDPPVRRNRLALLQRLHRQFMQIADLSCLSTGYGDARGE